MKADFHAFVRHIHKQAQIRGHPTTEYIDRYGLAVITASWTIGGDTYEILYQSNHEKKLGMAIRHSSPSLAEKCN